MPFEEQTEVGRAERSTSDLKYRVLHFIGREENQMDDENYSTFETLQRKSIEGDPYLLTSAMKGRVLKAGRYPFSTGGKVAYARATRQLCPFQLSGTALRKQCKSSSLE